MKWVHGVYTKGGGCEVFNAPATASWTVRKLCAMTAALRQWICNTTYSIKEVYKHNLVTPAKVRWRGLVWNRTLIPKHKFVIWLVARQGLKTRDKLSQLGVVNDGSCPLCGSCTEMHQHLFFECPLSRRVEEVKSWIGITLKPIALMDFRSSWIVLMLLSP